MRNYKLMFAGTTCISLLSLDFVQLSKAGMCLIHLCNLVTKQNADAGD